MRNLLFIATMLCFATGIFCQATTTADSADLQLSKAATFVDVDMDGFASEGDSIKYTFNVTNTGEIDLYDISITDPLFADSIQVMTGSGTMMMMTGSGSFLSPMTSAMVMSQYAITNDNLRDGRVVNTAAVHAFFAPGAVISSLSDDPSDDSNIDSDNDNNPDDPTITFLNVDVVGLPCGDGTRPSLGCADALNVTLGSDCKAVLDPIGISQANGIPLIIEVRDQNDNVIDTMGIEHVGEPLRYYAIDTCSGASCWGNINLELKRIPALTTNTDTVMCGADFSILGLRSVEDVKASIGDICILNVQQIREEVENQGSRCDTIVTIRKIVGIVDIDDLPRKVTLHIDTLYEVPLTTDMVSCPHGETLEEAIYVDCDIADGVPTPDQIAEMRGDTAAYPFVDKGMVTTSKVTFRDSLVRDTTAQLVQINGVWINADVITKNTVRIFDTIYTTNRVVLPIKPGETCNMSVIYTDELFEGCVGPDTKILRTWSILNWCSGEEKTCVQWIIIDDQKGPVITPLRDTTLNVSPWKCFVSLPLDPEVMESCGNYRLEWTSSHGNILGDSLITGIQLVDGPATVYLRAVDDCNNETRDTFTITAFDGVAPIVQSADRINVTLTGEEPEGFASILVESIDVGSTDAGCGEITRCILLKEELENPVLNPDNGDQLYDSEGNAIYHAAQCKVDGTLKFIGSIVKGDTTYNFVDYVICKEVVKLCCDNIGENEVALVVDDMSPASPTSYGWTIVDLEDKLTPVVTCPEPITIDCETDIDDVVIPRPSVSGSVCASQSLEYTLVEDLNTCEQGQINVLWTLDGAPVCTSIILVRASNSFDPLTIKWPRYFNDETELGLRRECEIIGYGPDSVAIYSIVETPETIPMGNSLECGETVLVEPVWCEGPCGQVLSSYEDQVVESADACKKIVRRWTIIDWCTWTPNTEDGEDDTDTFQAVNDEWIDDDSPCEDCHKKESEDVYFRYTKVDLDGHYDFIQVIKILDEIDPEITVDATKEVEIAGGADTKDDPTLCTDSDLVTASVTDMCGELDLDASTIRWSIEVYDAEGNKVSGPKRVTGATATMTTGDGAPGVVHTIVWTATDDCGNKAIAETIVSFVDNRNPVAVCIEKISTATMNTDGSALIWAADYDLGSFDNCGEVEVYFRNSLGDKVPSLTFGCEDVPNGVSSLKDVQVFFADQFGNESYCFARLRIDDNGDNCPNIDVDEAMIAGEVRTEIGDMVENAEVTVIGTGRAATTEVDGAYVFPQLATSEVYQISAQRNDAPLNGVSTLDLVQIQQHILGIRLLDTPYKVIAADVNSDSKVSAVDLVQLRQLLLGRTIEFPQNESWRFVDAGQTFERLLSPFPFTELITIDPLQNDRMEEDFIGIKTGDVSGNAIANSLIAAGERSTATLDFNIKDEVVSQGQVEIPVRASNFQNVAAYQMTMHLDQAKVLEVKSGAITVDKSFAILDDNTITMAWYTPAAITSDEILFTIVADVAKEGSLHELISIDGAITPAKAYLADDKALEVGLTWIKENGISAFSLLQNTPNPWGEETSISFVLPEAGETTLRVLDLTGRIVWQYTEQLPAGLNAISVDKSNIGSAGIWYYELQSGAHSATRKMIVIE